MNDLISRRAAIDALHTRFKDGFNEDKWWNSTHVLAAIEGLPPAQPEIIHCRECKHHRQDNHGLFYCSRKEYGYGWGLNDFCSDAERRTDE